MDPGGEVYILDFSYPLETMLETHARHRGRVTLIDHHQTARDELEGAVPNCRFDLEHSGAYLAWEWWAGPGETMPGLVRYIEDRDLWRWELRNSREVAAALDSYPKDFHVWDTLAIDALALEGEAILRRERLMVEKLIDLAVRRTVGGFPVPAVNTPVLVSETCEALLGKFPDASFAAAYSELPGPDGEIRERWSLRSRPGFDVSRTARRLPRLPDGGHGLLREDEPRRRPAVLTLHASARTRQTRSQDRPKPSAKENRSWPFTPLPKKNPRYDPATGLIIRTFLVCDGNLTATLEKAGTPYHHHCDEYDVREPQQFRYWMDLQAPNAELGGNNQWCPRTMLGAIRQAD